MAGWTDEERAKVLRTLTQARRLLRSHAHLNRETRECMAILLEQFEATILAMDKSFDRYGRS